MNPDAIKTAALAWERGRALQTAGQLAEADTHFRAALKVMPTSVALLADYGKLAEQAQDWPGAVNAYRRIGELRPDAKHEGKLGLLLFKCARFSEAIPYLQTHLARSPDDVNVMLPLGLALSGTLQWDAALEVAHRLETLRPTELSAEMLLNSLYNLGRGDELDAPVEAALQRYPDSPLVQAVCAMHLMKRGDGRRGFAWPHAVRWRYQPGYAGPSTTPTDWWDGKPFAGVLLVNGEQGLGEEILAASMFNDLLRTAQRAIVRCDPRLLPLFRRSFPGLEFVDRTTGTPTDAIPAGTPHRQIAALDLSHYFRREATLPAQPPWLVPDPVRVATLRARYRAQFPDQLVGGLSWKSRRTQAEGPDKTVSLQDLAAVLHVPKINWLSVQYGDVNAELADLAAGNGAIISIDPSVDPLNDIDGLAAQMQALDLVVSTSNTTAHLAGAVGANCHLLLPCQRPVFWYWGYEGRSTPWYPSITIHRNRREDDWKDLATRIAIELGEPAADIPSPRTS